MPQPIQHIDESGFYSQQDFIMTNTNSNAKSNTYNTQQTQKGKNPGNGATGVGMT